MQIRHEAKFYLNRIDVLSMRRRIQSVMELDPHVKNGENYLVRSLYFDSPADKVLRDKIDDESDREKFRIRLYDHDPGFIRLEKKVKRGRLTEKCSAPLTAGETRMLLEGESAFLSKSSEPLHLELYARMKSERLSPKTVVDYLREPYVYRAGNVRVTLDCDIRTGIFCRDILDDDLVMVPAAPGLTLMEVKYDAFLPDVIRDILQMGNREVTSFSKYMTGRRFG